MIWDKIWLVIYYQLESVGRGWFWSLLRRRRLAGAQGGRSPRRGRSRAGTAHAGWNEPGRFLSQTENLHLIGICIISWTQSGLDLLISCDAKYQFNTKRSVLWKIYLWKRKVWNLSQTAPTCLQSEDREDLLEEPGNAGKSGLSETSGRNYLKLSF